VADVNLEITVPDAWTSRVLAAFTAITNTHIQIISHGSSVDHIDFHGKIDFKIDEQQPGETAKQFGERVLRDFGKHIVKLVELAADEVRYDEDVADVNPPTENVPEDILQ